VAGGALLQLVRLAPLGNALAYVLDNDIFYRPSSYGGTEEKRITFNGNPGVVYNGVPDWVYEGDHWVYCPASYSVDRWFHSPPGHRLLIALILADDVI
jgi:dipeptidyl-peptidase-4